MDTGGLDIPAIGQGIVAIIIMVGLVFTGVRKFFADKKNGNVRVPGDALSKASSSDPQVRRLEKMIERMDGRLTSQQEQLDAADRRDLESRKRIGRLEEGRSADHRTMDILRSIIRRLIAAWGNDFPELSASEWNVVGIDEDTQPRPNLTSRRPRK